VLAPGQDPSQAAFWLPFQDPISSYRHAAWVATSTCFPQVELCNQADDNCDGVLDDSCREPHTETCGDGVDDDYDAISDEGCGCSTRDVCGDELDNDCDGQVDEMMCSSGRP